MFGIDFSSLLAQKYAIMQQQANADSTRANAGLISANSGANLDNVKAGLLPGESAANIAEQQARTGNINATTKYVGPLALSTIGLQRRQGQYYGAGANNLNSEAAGNNILNEGQSFAAYLQRLRESNAASSGGL